MNTRMNAECGMRNAKLFRVVVLVSLLGAVMQTRVMAQSEIIRRAMRDEMARNVSDLKLDTIAAPYFIAYRIDDQKSFHASAAFGALISSNSYHSRLFRIGIRVGTPAFDNTNFFTFSSGSGLRFTQGASGTTLEDNYDALRRDLWLSTDGAYKSALQEISKKRAAFEHKTRSDDTVDFSPAPPNHTTIPPRTIAFDSVRWTTLVRMLSAVFAEYKDIQSCNVSVGLSNGMTYYITNEGTDIAEPGTTVRVEVTASSQAPDGMPLSDALQWVESSPDYLPSAESMLKDVRAMAERLNAARTAPIVDEYTGPVLVEGQASTEIFQQVLGDAFCAIRRPDVENPQMKMALGMLAKESPFQSRIGSRILPDGFTVDDLAQRDTLYGRHTIGSQPDDDEGVVSRDVRLVDHGILKTLLTCRTPHKRFQTSNGRASGMPARAAITNLIFNNAKGVSDAELKEKLLEQIKARELPFGIRIVRMMPSNVRSSDPQEMIMMFMSTMGSGDGDGQKVSRPATIYKVFPDGREELVRGVEIAGVGLSAFKEILAAGSQPYVYNTIIDVKGQSSIYQGNDTKTATIAAPSVLFDELTVKKIAGPFKTLPVVEAP